ncbi:MAG: hypothetical protein Q9159_004886 [Coniocarpon cinnabarinum]
MESHHMGIAVAGYLRAGQEKEQEHEGEKDTSLQAENPSPSMLRMMLSDHFHKSRSPVTKSDAHAICIEHSLQVAHYARIYNAQLDYSFAPPTLMQWIVVAMFGLLEALDDAECSAAFCDLCIYLRSYSRAIPLAKGMFRLVQLRARSMQAALPLKTRVLFDDFEASDWRREDGARLTSNYPDAAAAFAGQGWDRSEVEMDRILQRTSNLDLDGRSEPDPKLGEDVIDPRLLGA